MNRIINYGLVINVRLLVIGGSGLLGFKVAELAVEERFETYATYNFRPIQLGGCDYRKLDKTIREDTLAMMRKIKPDAVIDTAALHNVNYCETHQDEAWRVNVGGTRNVANACREVGAKMIFISTDYVFDGKKGFYNEEDAPNPIHHYAKTKLEAEKVVKEVSLKYAIARPSVIYGWNPSELAGLRSSSGKSMNFVIWTIDKLKRGEEINIVTDQYSSPTLADNLAEALLSLSRSPRGLYHTAGKTCLNRFEFANKIAEMFGFDVNLIKPVTSDVFKQVAKRPKRCCLNVSKAERELGVRLLTVEEGLMKMKEQIVALTS